MADDLEGLNFTISLEGTTKKAGGAYMKNSSTQRISTNVPIEGQDNGQASFFTGLANIFSSNS